MEDLLIPGSSMDSVGEIANAVWVDGPFREMRKGGSVPEGKRLEPFFQFPEIVRKTKVWFESRSSYDVS